jgi:hypothetical protein
MRTSERLSRIQSSYRRGQPISLPQGTLSRWDRLAAGWQPADRLGVPFQGPVRPGASPALKASSARPAPINGVPFGSRAGYHPRYHPAPRKSQPPGSRVSGGCWCREKPAFGIIFGNSDAPRQDVSPCPPPTPCPQHPRGRRGAIHPAVRLLSEVFLRASVPLW